MEPNDTPVRLVQNPPVTVTATFNPAMAPERVTFDKKDIDFANGAPGKVTFKLAVETKMQVRFASNPIQWVRKIDETGPDSDENLRPINPPSEATVSRMDDGTTMITIAPDPGNTLTLRFFVIVQTMQGRFVGSDPTIVTMPPDKT
jgi:hypothetical protein